METVTLAEFLYVMMPMLTRTATQEDTAEKRS